MHILHKTKKNGIWAASTPPLQPPPPLRIFADVVVQGMLQVTKGISGSQSDGRTIGGHQLLHGGLTIASRMHRESAFSTLELTSVEDTTTLGPLIQCIAQMSLEGGTPYDPPSLTPVVANPNLSRSGAASSSMPLRVSMLENLIIYRMIRFSSSSRSQSAAIP
jgi:hypothetical protein